MVVRWPRLGKIGYRGFAVEKEVRKGPGSATRSDEPAGADVRDNGKPAVRYASDEQFRKAQKKTKKLHAGLFKRLAQ